MFEPSQFQVNETWIAFKLNDAPVSTDADGDFNVLALMDAASCFILGTEFVRADLSEPSQMESKRLLKGGQTHKQQYPKTLIIPTNQAADILCTEAKLLGISVVRVPEDQLLVFISEARQGFQEHVSGGKVQ
jgi:hypothetical protein